MSKQPKISIIIPVYNVEEDLPRCLDSVIAQTLLDIEVICVNDGSPDNSRNIIKEYQKLDGRIKLIDKENGGLSSARNAGIRNASGEYIVFWDSDDFLEENACDRLYIEILEARADVIIFGANTFPASPFPGTWLVENLSPRTINYNSFRPDILFRERGAYPFVWRYCIKREFLNQCKLLFDESVKFGEDLIFQFCLLPQASIITFISDKLYNYRWYRENSLMSNAAKDFSKKIEMHLKEAFVIASYWKEKGVIEVYGKDFLIWTIEFLYYDIYQLEQKEKIMMLKKLVAIWKSFNLLKFYHNVPPKTRDSIDSILGTFSRRIRIKKGVLLLPRILEDKLVRHR